MIEEGINKNENNVIENNIMSALVNRIIYPKRKWDNINGTPAGTDDIFINIGYNQPTNENGAYRKAPLFGMNSQVVNDVVYGLGAQQKSVTSYINQLINRIEMVHVSPSAINCGLEENSALVSAIYKLEYSHPDLCINGPIYGRNNIRIVSEKALSGNIFVDKCQNIHKDSLIPLKSVLIAANKIPAGTDKWINNIAHTLSSRLSMREFNSLIAYGYMGLPCYNTCKKERPTFDYYTHWMLVAMRNNKINPYDRIQCLLDGEQISVIEYIKKFLCKH